MKVHKYLILSFVCFAAVISLFGMNEQLVQDDWKIELNQINSELKELQDEKNRYLAAARRYENEGMRWQFQQDQKQEAKRAFEMADIKRRAANMLQMRIDALNARKAQILQGHPEANDI